MLGQVDVLVLLKLVARGGAKWTQPDIAYELSVSQSTVSRALHIAESLRLYASSKKRVNVAQLEDALVHGARYFLPAKQSGEVRGIVTAWAAPPLAQELFNTDPLPPVWADPEGDIRGLSVEPLHPAVPRAARRDPALYALLAILDVLRLGASARESNLAKKAFHEHLNGL